MGVMYKITEMPAPEWPAKYSDELGELYRKYVMVFDIKSVHIRLYVEADNFV